MDMNGLQIASKLALRPSLDDVMRARPKQVGGFEYLSADSLLDYCMLRMRDLDSNIRQRMETQKEQIAHRKDVQGVLDSLSNTYHVKGPQSATDWDKAAKQVRDLAATFPEGDSRREELNRVAGEMDARGGPLAEEHATWWQGYQNAVKTVGEDIKSSMELSMIEIQSLTSQRQTAIQLVTNLMAKMNEATLSIAQKI